MIFKSEKSKIVWDATKNKPLCKFIDGEYETNDEHKKAELIRLGYEHEFIDAEFEDIEELESDETPDEIIEEETNLYEEMTEEELKALVKTKGIKGWSNMKRETLIAKLEGD